MFKVIGMRSVCLVTQCCPTLCDSMDCRPPGSSVQGDSPGMNTGVGCHACLQGLFPIQGSNPGLPHCRRILCHLNYKGSQTVSFWLFTSAELYVNVIQSSTKSTTYTTIAKMYLLQKTLLASFTWVNGGIYICQYRMETEEIVKVDDDRK